MNQYHKVQSVFKRDPENNFKTLLEGEYSKPEFKYLYKNVWWFTEKVDGTNIRVMFDGENLSFGGKTDKAVLPIPLSKTLPEIFTLDKMKNVFVDEPICLYGEGYGARIQKGGGNYRGDQSFVLFDVRIGKWWLNRKDVNEIAEKLEIESVPYIGHGGLDYMVEKCKEGFKSRWGAFPAEGIVARPDVELFGRDGKRIITKLKCKDFE